MGAGCRSCRAAASRGVHGAEGRRLVFVFDAASGRCGWTGRRRTAATRAAAGRAGPAWRLDRSDRRRLGNSGGRPGPPRRLARRITPHQTGEARQPKRQNPFSNASFTPGIPTVRIVSACVPVKPQAHPALHSFPPKFLRERRGSAPPFLSRTECSRNSGEKEAVKDQ